MNAPLAAETPSPTSARLFAFLLLLLAISVGVVAVSDELGDRSAPVASRPAGAAPVRHAGARRAFVFIIDSLAYDAAVDPTLMPNLVALQATSVYGKVQASRDAVTTPALRAAFTGQDSFRVLGFVRNFVSGAQALGSLFGDARRAGLRSAAWSDGAMDQFAGELASLRSNEVSGGPTGETEVDRQLAASEQALQAYLRREFDVVVLHVDFTDHAAHTKASHPERFREAFAAADRFVGRLAAEVPREEILVVMGDHGHNATGNHALGIDVPTYASYRGAAYAQQVDIAPALLMDHRYLLGFGLGLDLPPTYQGRTHAGALRPDGPLPAAYAATATEPAAQGRPIAVFVLLAAAAGALGACAIAFAERRRVGGRLAAAGAAAGVALLAWGCLLAWARPRVHEPWIPLMQMFWGAIVVIAVAIGLWRGARVGAWGILGAGALLLYPTVYRYGSMASMVPAWVALLLLVHLGAAIAGDRRYWASRIAGTAFAFLLIQPFFLPESFSFRFDHWVPLIACLAPATERDWTIAALIAKVVLAGIVACEGSGRRALLRAAAAILFAGGIAFVEEAPRAATSPVVLGIAVALWLAARAARGGASWAGGLGRLAAALLASIYFIRVPVSFHRSFDCLAAALAVTGVLVRGAREEDRRSHHAFLLCLGTIAAGWCTLAFGSDRLEWQALYDVFAPPVVEHHVAWFLPVLVGRFALPMVIVRLALRPSLPTEPRAAEARALAIVGVGFLSMLCVGLGLARVMPGSSVYLECCQHDAVLWMVALGIAVPLGE